MHRIAGDWLIAGARIGLLVLVLFASAAYGLTRPWSMDVFNVAAGLVFALWLLGNLVSLRAPRTGFLPWLLVILILVFGWGVTGLGYADDWLMDSPEDFPDAYYEITAYGTYSFSSSFAAMIRTTALLGLFLVTIDTFACRRWGRALLVTLAAAAVGMVIFFYLQKLFGGPFLLRDLFNRTNLAFATYRYWGNAASFLGLLWPLVAALAIYAAIRRALGWSLWMAAALLVFAALYLNTSKAGHVLGVVGLVLFLLLVFVHVTRAGVLRRWNVHPVMSLVVIVPLAGIALSLYFAIPQERWDRLTSSDLEDNPRFIAYQYFMEMVPNAGWTGYGPGTFAEAHRQHVEEDRRIRKVPFWVAHQDYLQTLIEWGYAGTALWALLLVPSSARLLQRSLGSSDSRYRSADRTAYGLAETLELAAKGIPSPSNPLVQGAAFTSVAVTALHAGVDFPMQIESLQFYFLTWIALGWTRPGSSTQRSSQDEWEDGY